MVTAAFIALALLVVWLGHREFMKVESGGSVPLSRRAGCAWLLLGLNALLIGITAFSFSQGPYSSDEQELWYRYGSLSFLLGGVIVPAIALLAFARKSAVAVSVLTAWMAAAFFAFLIYVFYSGGGV